MHDQSVGFKSLSLSLNCMDIFCSFICYLQMVDKDFNVKEKVTQVLLSSGFALKRARNLDIDDFLRFVNFSSLNLM